MKVLHICLWPSPTVLKSNILRVNNRTNPPCHYGYTFSPSVTPSSSPGSFDTVTMPDLKRSNSVGSQTLVPPEDLDLHLKNAVYSRRGRSTSPFGRTLPQRDTPRVESLTPGEGLCAKSMLSSRSSRSSRSSIPLLTPPESVVRIETVPMNKISGGSVSPAISITEAEQEPEIQDEVTTPVNFLNLGQANVEHLAVPSNFSQSPPLTKILRESLTDSREMSRGLEGGYIGNSSILKNSDAKTLNLEPERFPGQLEGNYGDSKKVTIISPKISPGTSTFQAQTESGTSINPENEGSMPGNHKGRDPAFHRVTTDPCLPPEETTVEQVGAFDLRHSRKDTLGELPLLTTTHSPNSEPDEVESPFTAATIAFSQQPPIGLQISSGQPTVAPCNTNATSNYGTVIVSGEPDRRKHRKPKTNIATPASTTVRRASSAALRMSVQQTENPPSFPVAASQKQYAMAITEEFPLPTNFPPAEKLEERRPVIGKEGIEFPQEEGTTAVSYMSVYPEPMAFSGEDFFWEIRDVNTRGEERGRAGAVRRESMAVSIRSVHEILWRDGYGSGIVTAEGSGRGSEMRDCV
ncbi:hypothetical protein RUND412_004944 [Rhizina undulata]